MKKKYKIIKEDCIKWMTSQSPKSVDCIVTSPPYNLNVKYGGYDDSAPRKVYLVWLGEVAKAIKKVLKDKGQLFLNMGYSNSDPFVAMDVAQVFRKYFVLQNQFTWVKHIVVNDFGHGQYKPITSNRYTSADWQLAKEIKPTLFTQNYIVKADTKLSQEEKLQKK